MQQPRRKLADAPLMTVLKRGRWTSKFRRLTLFLSPAARVSFDFLSAIPEPTL